jgi:hypothetical protein
MSENKPKKVIQCPHCKTHLIEGEKLCCQALQDELNTLANTHGATIDQLAAAFSAWFKAHEVKTHES